MTATDITALSIGIGLMAAFALHLRRRDRPRLGAALGALALFALLLTLFLLPGLAGNDLPGWLTGWELLLLPALPILLRRYLDGLTGTAATRRDWLWALAPGVLLLPFLLVAPAARQALLAGDVPDLAPPLLLAAVVSVGLFWLAWLAVTLASAFAIAIRLRRHRARLAAIYSTEGRGDLRGFVVTAALLGGIFLVQLGEMIAAGFGVELLSGRADDLFLLAVIFGIAVHGLTVEPPLPEWVDDALSVDDGEPDAPAPPAGTRPAYARSGLADADLDRILDRLDRSMADGQLWADPMLTLKDLAEAASVRPGYLSQALNQRRGVSFFDYVNGLRIDAACDLLLQSDRTALAIAQEVGFNAKSTFNAAFRKARGMSPSAWRDARPEE
ncbi:helix-turn-helix transcriptional regulator [Sandaracinobacter sp. RS1-74]|uniref:helix-turn-helix domain-containing protein n=1 Tax=Sandaracinobacteroides sayramensis TaxID=2913411 RepID=UPI001EDBF017|nr:helix-turn-helix transcriptional regulator [Sandaracinobacteroides sayramensis]MCG2841203.1 helix-turn-helix transcriptional regulator [Sandaracinobacteroides sayramensis]